MSGWITLLLAGCAEIGFTTCMKLSNEFTNLKYVVGFAIFAILSFWLLNKSLTQIPLGTAYAVWTGIGAFGTALIGIMFFHDPASLTRMFFLSLLIGSIVALKFF